MNVMKQDAMDEKIKERCKICEKQCMQEDLNRSTSCREAIEGPRDFLFDPPVVEATIEIAIGNSLISRQIGQVSRRCRGRLKTFFQKGKNTDMNAIKHATQLMIESTC